MANPDTSKQVYYPEGISTSPGISREGSRSLEKIQAGVTLSSEEAEAERINYLKGFNQDNLNDNRDQQPSNITGAGNPIDNNESENNPLNVQILRPAIEKNEFPTTDGKSEEINNEQEPKSENPDWAKEGNDHWVSGGEPLSAEELSETTDWDLLMVRWAKAGLPTEDFPDKSDFHGPEASIIAAMTRRNIEMAELSKEEMGVLHPEKDGKSYDVDLTIDRLENKGAKKILEKLIIKYGPDYLTHIWINAKSVDLYTNKDGQTMIMFRATKIGEIEPFFVLSSQDFSRMLSVPSVKDGNSRIDIPDIDPKNKQDQYKMISILAKLTVDGQLIGGKDFDNFNFGRR